MISFPGVNRKYSPPKTNVVPERKITFQVSAVHLSSIFMAIWRKKNRAPPRIIGDVKSINPKLFKKNISMQAILFQKLAIFSRHFTLAVLSVFPFSSPLDLAVNLATALSDITWMNTCEVLLGFRTASNLFQLIRFCSYQHISPGGNGRSRPVDYGAVKGARLQTRGEMNKQFLRFCCKDTADLFAYVQFDFWRLFQVWTCSNVCHFTEWFIDIIS